MKKILAVLVVAGLVIIAAYSASAWYLGRQVELAVSEPYKQLESVPYVKIVKREYRRGIFTSDETVTLELFGNLTQFIEQSQRQNAARSPEATPAEPFKPIRFTVRSRIKHGPLADGKDVAAAAVDSELEVDERFKPALAKVLGDRKMLTAHTIYHFDGDGESAVTSPAFVTAIPGDGASPPDRLSWGGVNATVRFAKEFASYTMQGEAPKLEVEGGKGVHMVVEGMRFDMLSKRVFDDEPLLHAGKQKFTIAQARIDGPMLANDVVVVTQFAYDVNAPINGEFIDVVARIGVQDARFGESNYGPAHFDMSVKRLHARTLAQLQRAMLKMYSDPAAFAADAKNPGAAFGPLAQPALVLLGHNPEISLDRVSFKTPQGEVLLAARAKFNDIKPDDLKQPPVLIAKLDASADISFPEGLLMVPYGIKPDSAEAMQAQMQMRGKQIAALVEQGYIRREGGMVASRLEFRNGQFTVNGKPFDPQSLRVQAPPPSPPPVQPGQRNRRPVPSR